MFLNIDKFLYKTQKLQNSLKKIFIVIGAESKNYSSPAGQAIRPLVTMQRPVINIYYDGILSNAANFCYLDCDK